MTLQAFLALLKLLSDLEPVGIEAVRALIDKINGLTPEQISQLTISINNKSIEEIDAELAKLPPKA